MSNSFLYRKILTPRRLMIDYQAPPICEGDFTSTGVSTISLQPILRPVGPTGLVVNWDGSRWWLTWNIYPGALCYSLYRLNDVLDPFSEWTLVAECVSGNSIILPNPGIYGLTVITLDGESEPSEPIEAPVVDPGAPPPVVPPPTPETCPPETGTETPNDLMIPEDTDLGDLVPDPFQEDGGYTYWGEFPQAQYEISYQGGAWKDETNPYPDQFKLTSLRWVFDGGETDPFFGNSYGADTQAEVEAAYEADCEVVAAFCTLKFIHDEGNIGIRHIRFGTPDEPTPGSPNPTWKLKRTGTWPSFPARVRIAGYDVSKFEGIADCNANAGGQDPWDGTFDARTISIPFWFWWESSAGLASTIQGKTMLEARATWWNSNPNTSTGAGWLLYINLYNDGGIIDAWTGIKNVGTSPVGTYYRSSGCLTAPGCLTLEAY
jgi:hypothetical protein